MHSSATNSNCERALLHWNAGIAIFGPHDYLNLRERFLPGESIGRGCFSEVHGSVRIGSPAADARIIEIRPFEPQKNLWCHGAEVGFRHGVKGELPKGRIAGRQKP